MAVCVYTHNEKTVLNVMKQLIKKFYQARRTPQAGVSETWVQSTDFHHRLCWDVWQQKADCYHHKGSSSWSREGFTVSPFSGSVLNTIIVSTFASSSCQGKPSTVPAVWCCSMLNTHSLWMGSRQLLFYFQVNSRITRWAWLGLTPSQVLAHILLCPH